MKIIKLLVNLRWVCFLRLVLEPPAYTNRACIHPFSWRVSVCSSDRSILFEVTISLESFHPERVGVEQCAAETFSPADRGSTLAAFQMHWAVATFTPWDWGLVPGSSSHNTEAAPLQGLVWHYHTGLTWSLYQQAPWLTRLCWSLPNWALPGSAEACCDRFSGFLRTYRVVLWMFDPSTSVVMVRGCYSQHAWFYSGFSKKLWCSLVFKGLKWRRNKVINEMKLKSQTHQASCWMDIKKWALFKSAETSS